MPSGPLNRLPMYVTSDLESRAAQSMKISQRAPQKTPRDPSSSRSDELPPNDCRSDLRFRTIHPSALNSDGLAASAAQQPLRCPHKSVVFLRFRLVSHQRDWRPLSCSVRHRHFSRGRHRLFHSEFSSKVLLHRRRSCILASDRCSLHSCLLAQAHHERQMTAAAMSLKESGDTQRLPPTVRGPDERSMPASTPRAAAALVRLVRVAVA